ncbi:MAG: C1 family peptidase [Saprospiraceae bacterium]
MVRFLWIVILLVSFLADGFGQGVEFNDSIYHLVPKLPDYGDGGKSEASEIAKYPKIDLRPYCPTPGYQGVASTCTGWAVGYAAMSISWAINNNWENKRDSIDKNVFSALYLYNQITESTDCSKGTEIVKALDLLVEEGNIRARDFDKKNQDCSRKPSEEEIEKAKEFRIRDYTALFDTSATFRVRIEKTKLCLINKKPVIIAVWLLNNFLAIRPGNSLWYPQIGDPKPVNKGHAMVVVGYDDGIGAFEVMNSWGEGWANGGFIWIKYEDYAKHVRYAFEMTLNNESALPPSVLSPPSSPNFVGSFFIRVPKMTLDGIKFNNVPTIEKDGLYSVNIPTQRDSSRIFQIGIKGVSKGGYVYAFSYDPRGKITVHWPRDATLDSKFEGLHESAVITTEKVELILPKEDSAFKLLYPEGKEYLCILFSRYSIKNLNSRLEQIRTMEGAFPSKFSKAFSADLISKSGIKYYADRFEAFSQKGKIVPVIIEIQVSP